MAEHVYEGLPDARQSSDPAMPTSRFRPRYRALSEEEKALHDEIKAGYAAVEGLIDRVPINSPERARYRALAMTALEESCMWAVKELTS